MERIIACRRLRHEPKFSDASPEFDQFLSAFDEERPGSEVIFACDMGSAEAMRQALVRLA